MMFNISSFFIARPVLSAVINIVITVLGLVSYFKVPIREYPNIERKTVTVSMEYAGASVDVVESQIAYKFEETLSSLEGLKGMRSSISQGVCDITLEFDTDRDIDAAANDVESKLRRIRSDLPENLREPTISKADSSAVPYFGLTLSGGNYTSSELSDLMARYVKSELESISGIASVRIPGQTGTSLTYAIDVHMRPQDMAAMRVTPEEVFRALSTQSFIQPAGDIISGNRSYRMTVRAGLSSISEFENISIVREKGGSGRVIRIRDVADVKLNDEDKNQRIRYNGKVVSSCYINTQPSANVIDISKKIKAKIAAIKQAMPDKDLDLELVFDRSLQIDSSIKNLIRTIIEAVVLVTLIVFVFLKSFRSTIIPLITIPICLLSGIFIIYIFGFTINIITLLAMLLAVGIVVDDSFVVIEKISLNIERGMKPLEASIKGMAEIQASIIGMTLTLVAVYLPLTLLNSGWGKFFKEFAVTLAGMVLFSGLVAFVLSPTLSALILSESSDEKPYRFLDWFDRLFNSAKSLYARGLRVCLKNKEIVVGSSILIFIASLFVARYGLINVAEPDQDKGFIFLTLSTNHANLDYVTPVLEKLEEISKDKSVKGVSSDYQGGSDQANIRIALLNDPRKRKSCFKIVEEMRKKYDEDLIDFMPRYSFFPSPLAESNRFTVTVKSNKSYDDLEEVGADLLTILKGMPAPFKTKNLQFTKTKPEKTFNTVPNRERANMAGVRLDDIRGAIKWITRGNPPADRYEKDGRQYPIRLWISEENRKDARIVEKFLIRSSTKRNEITGEYELLPLKDLISIEESTIRPLVIHDGSQRAFDLYCEFEKKDVDMIKAYKEFEKRANKILPTGYSIIPGRNINSLIEESGSMITMIVLALIFVYLIMAAQFESFIDPFIVLCTAPLAMSCALLSLYFFPGGSLNAYSNIAILTLIGLITKHGILLVEFFKQKLETAGSINRAITEAAMERFRPIIMTTLAMVLGTVPLLIAHGSGYEGPQQVGIVIVGGLTLGTVMTLFVVPCLCVMFQKLRNFNN